MYNIIYIAEIIFSVRKQRKEIHNMLKKSTYILLSLLLCIPLVFIIILSFTINIEAPVDSTDITIQTADGSSFSFNEAQDLSIYSEAVRNASKVSGTPDMASDAVSSLVTYTDTEGQYSHNYYISLDTDNCYYENAQGEFFKFRKVDAKTLLERQEFSYLYPNYTVPTLTISSKEKSFGANIGEYEWSFKRGSDFEEGLPVGESESESEVLYFDKNEKFSLNFSLDPDTCDITVYNGNTTVHSASWESFADGADDVTEALLGDLYSKINYTNDTPLVCEITAVWQQIDSSEYYGEATYTAELIFDVPFTCKKVDPRLTPGQFTFIKLNNLNDNEAITFISENDGLTLPETRAHKIGDMTFAFLPIDLSTKPGTYKIKAISDKTETEFSMTVSNKDFKSAKVSTIHGMAGYDSSKLELEALVKTITAQSEEKHYWADSEVENTSSSYSKKYQFKKPVNATASEDFGVKVTEDINLLQSTPYTRNYVFYEADKGSDVVATASGKVAHVGATAYSGTFIIIDHGFGLLSIYENLSESLVSSGDEVSAGMLIGKTGDKECGYTFKSGMRFSVCMEGKYINPTSNIKGIFY